MIGPRALELGRYMQNQLPEGVPLAVREPLIRERLAIFSEALNLPPKIVAASTLVDCVLSHCWGFEEEALNPDWYEGIEMGYLMRQIMEA